MRNTRIGSGHLGVLSDNSDNAHTLSVGGLFKVELS